MALIATFTDSRTHGPYESIYALLRKVQSIVPRSSLYVIDRAHPKNSDLFRTFEEKVAIGKQVDESFKFSAGNEWFSDGDQVDLENADVILLRIDRPFSDEQLKAVHRRFSKSFIVNDPNGIIKTGSKKYLLNFPELCPEMKYCASIRDIEEFVELFDSVLKPTHGFGGEGIVRITSQICSLGNEEVSRKDALRYLDEKLSVGQEYLAMRYLKRVGEGDKRVVVVGNSVLGATLRLPASGGFLCNMKEGGSAHPAEPDKDEMRIAETLIPRMKDEGVLIFGFDTLVGNDGIRVLSEINTLNVGGFIQAEEFSGRPIIEEAAKELVDFLRERGQPI